MGCHFQVSVDQASWQSNQPRHLEPLPTLNIYSHKYRYDKNALSNKYVTFLISRLKFLIKNSGLKIMTESLEPKESEQKIEPCEEVFEEATGRFSRQGLSWLPEMRLFLNQAPTPNEVMSTIEAYYKYASDILHKSPLAEGLDLNNKEDIPKLENRLASHQYSSEWWAGKLITQIVQICHIMDNMKKEDNEIQSALWEMNKLTNTYSMLVFKETLEATLWSGYMVNNLKNILKIWNKYKGNDKELFWQKTFQENSIILSQVFSFPAINIKGTIYVGSKSYKNTGANQVDFLLKNNLTKNTALVEIKTPQTRITGKLYRDSVYSISTHITGAIVQISNYKDSLTKDYHTLVGNRKEGEEKINAFNPQCIVIAGNAQAELKTEAHIKSFELFRSGLKDVQLITYDELFSKIEILIDLIEGKDEAFP